MVTIMGNEDIRVLNKRVNVLSSQIAEVDKALLDIEERSKDITSKEDARHLRDAKGRTLRKKYDLSKERKELLIKKERAERAARRT